MFIRGYWFPTWGGCGTLGHMRRRRYVIATAVVVVFVTAVTALWPEREPQYEGKPLSFWIQQPNNWPAIRGIGTNAIPFLLHWMRTPEPRYRRLLWPVASKLPRRIRPAWAYLAYTERDLLSARALTAFRPEDYLILPELIKWAAETNSAQATEIALITFVGFGTNGVPPLLAVATNASHPYRNFAMQRLSQVNDLGPHAKGVASALIPALKDPVVNEAAALALGRATSQPSCVVPALVDCLKDTNSRPHLRACAADALVWFRENAEQALPSLTNALVDPDPEVRSLAAHSIEQIRIYIGEAKRR